MMSFPHAHVEKDLNRNEHLNLNLRRNTSLTDASHKIKEPKSIRLAMKVFVGN